MEIPCGPRHGSQLGCASPAEAVGFVLSGRSVRGGEGASLGAGPFSECARRVRPHRPWLFAALSSRWLRSCRFAPSGRWNVGLLRRGSRRAWPRLRHVLRGARTSVFFAGSLSQRTRPKSLAFMSQVLGFHVFSPILRALPRAAASARLTRRAGEDAAEVVCKRNLSPSLARVYGHSPVLRASWHGSCRSWAGDGRRGVWIAGNQRTEGGNDDAQLAGNRCPRPPENRYEPMTCAASRWTARLSGGARQP